MNDKQTGGIEIEADHDRYRGPKMKSKKLTIPFANPETSLGVGEGRNQVAFIKSDAGLSLDLMAIGYVKGVLFTAEEAVQMRDYLLRMYPLQSIAHEMVNEVSDLCNTAVVTDKMTVDEVVAYYDERLQKIYAAVSYPLQSIAKDDK